MHQTALIIFQKNEVLGKVKTRLAALVGDEKAMEIYKTLLHHTHLVIKAIDADHYIFYSDFIPKSVDNLIENYNFQVQEGLGLGERMKNAFNLLFQKGYQKVIIIGTDCADIEPRHIESAIQKLNINPIVIGPAEDGGYYLLGMKKFVPGIFDGIDWSTEKVFKQTIGKLESAELNFDTIEMLSDIDRVEDWEKVKLKFQ